MDNITGRFSTILRMRIKAKFIFLSAILALMICSLCPLALGEEVEPIYITGKVMTQDGVAQKNIPLKFTIYQEGGEDFSFDYITNYTGGYSVNYPVYEGEVAKISVTASKFGSGGYNEGIFRAGDTKKMNVIMIQSQCPLPVLIRGNIKHENGSPMPDTYVYLEVGILVKGMENTSSANNTGGIEKVRAGSTYTNDAGDYVIVPSAWTISGEGADARIFVTDPDYNILFSDNLRISCGSSVHKDILIEEKSTDENGTFNGEKSNLSEASEVNTSDDSNAVNGGDNNDSSGNSFLDPVLISLIVVIGLIILSVILLKFSKRNIK